MDAFIGTPITGLVVIPAITPGKCAAPPAPAMKTSAVDDSTKETVSCGVLCADKIFMSYDILKSASKLKWAKPCLKRYLVSHIKGEALEVTPDHWDTVAMLPLARFQKQSITEVYKQSRKKVNG